MPTPDSDGWHDEQIMSARQTRQRMLMRANGPSYEVVIDEIGIRRLLAPPEIVVAQLTRLVELHDEPKITIRVLPIDARIRGYRVVRSAFSLYAYPDQGDPEVVAVDTVTADLVLTTLKEEVQVRSYTDLYDRITEAALTPDDSTKLLATAAKHLLEGAGR